MALEETVSRGMAIMTSIVPETSHVPERRFSLMLYLLIVFGLSWPFFIVSVLGPKTIAWACIFNSLAMIMVGVGTFICSKYVFKDGLANAGWRWGSRKYWFAAIGIQALLWIVPALIDLSFGNLSLPKKLTTSQTAWVFEMLFVVLIPAFGEEIGWRGYMLPHMTHVMSPRKAVIWHGVIWYLWHLPLVGYAAFVTMQTIVQAEFPGSGLPVILFATAGALVAGSVLGVLDSAIFAKLWAGSGSIIIATVLHATGDGFRDSLSITIGSGPIGEIFTPVMTIVIGVYFLLKFRKVGESPADQWSSLFQIPKAE
jgi:uncharacterized protein